MTTVAFVKNALKHSETPLLKKIFHILKALRTLNLPAPRWVFKPLLIAIEIISGTLKNVIIFCFWTPLAKQIFITPPKRLSYHHFGLPFVSGKVDIAIGENCQLLKADFAGRSSPTITPKITIGDNVVIAHNVIILSGTSVTIEDHVMLAGDVRLNGFSGHPLDATKRLQGEPDQAEQIKPIHIKRNAWLGTGVTVSSGVTIGENTVVSTGSVVTKSLPANVLAAGVPAKIIRAIP